MKLTHRQKLRLARRMLQPWERQEGFNIFTSMSWLMRKAEIEAEVKKREEAQK